MPNRYKYILITLLFIIVGILHVYPDLRFIYSLGKDFQGIHLMGAGDETVYLSRIAGVLYRNDLRLANAGVYGHQDDPVYRPSLAEDIEGMIAKWLGLTIWQIDIWATFLLPTILCCLIYLLAHSLCGSFKFSALAALAITCAYYWITPNFKAIFSLSPYYFTLPLLSVRPISPQFHMLPFISSIYLIYKLSLSRSYYFIILTGITIGLLFYTTIYYWAFIYSGLGICLVIELFINKRKNIKKYLLVFLVSGLIGIPYWISFISLNKLPHFWDIYRRGGGIFTRQPIVPVIEIIFLIFLFLLHCILREKRRPLHYMISFVLAGSLCLNQQVITGKTVEPFHWQIFTNKTFIIISAFVCLSFILERVKQNRYFTRIAILLERNFIFYILCFILIGLGFIQQNFYYSANKDNFVKSQAIGEVLRYIHKELPAEAVILTDPFRSEEEQMISIFTKNYPYISGSFFITSAMSDAEVEERYFSTLHFFGYPVLEAENLFKYKNGGLFRGMQVHRFYGGRPEENIIYINGLKERYAKFITQDTVIALKRHKADYVLLAAGTQSRLLSNPKIAKLLEETYADNSYLLYKIKDEK